MHNDFEKGLGWHLCRTKLPRKDFNCKTKTETKTLKNTPKRPRKISSPVQVPKSFWPALVHSFAPAISNTISDFSFLQRESSGMATLRRVRLLFTAIWMLEDDLEGFCQNTTLLSTQKKLHIPNNLWGISFQKFYILFCWSGPDPNYFLKSVVFCALSMAQQNYISGSLGNETSIKHAIELHKWPPGELIKQYSLQQFTWGVVSEGFFAESLRKFCRKFAELCREIRSIAPGKGAEILRKVCRNFAEILRNIFCNDPSPNDPISELLICAQTLRKLRGPCQQVWGRLSGLNKCRLICVFITFTS